MLCDHNIAEETVVHALPLDHPLHVSYATAVFIFGWINMTHAISFKPNRLYVYF